MWNRAIDKYPLVICYCNNEEDVRNSILWSRKHQIGIRIRSGRHHYDGYSIGNEVLVIDVSRMNTISINEERQTVTIDGGVRNRELYEFLGVRGYPFPGGGCPTVGVVGFALGGGWGYSGRLLGLGCDAIEEIQLMNGEGEKIIASQAQNPELFWALKGSGGGQFGVVLRMSFRLPSKRQEATLIRLEYHETGREEQIQMFELFQETIQTACDEVNFKLSFYDSKEKGKGMLLLGIYYGDAQGAHEIIAPFIKVGRSIHIDIKTMSVLEVNRWIQDAHPDYEHYKSSGRFVNEKLTTMQIDTILDSIEKRANGAIYTAISCYGMGGQMRQVAHKDASFYYRESLYILGFQTVWVDNQCRKENKNWFLERFKRIEGITAGSFVNFPAGEIEDYRSAYYGEHRERLECIKKCYDPNGVFDFEQGL
ncbi:MAG: FAD-binding oxidoreductase [Cellulosilyticum sp.]|nr:FAD-binding oxidoreductase [Cellulosilyticum sp.]